MAVAALAGLGARGGADTGGAPGPAGADLLPDLVQEPPSGIVVSSSGRRHRLGFDSAIANIGTGPLIIEGRRPGAAPRMIADQIVRRADGTRRLVRGAGRLRYVSSADHSHWHLLGIERYELRRADGAAIGRRDRKTGFCLGDRYALPDPPAAAPADKVFRGRCGLGRPDLRSVRQGISVGYGDDYDALLEGQHIDITGLAAGRYQLVHRVNTDGAVRESNRANNAASALIELTRGAGGPRAAVLATCPGRARCPAPAPG